MRRPPSATRASAVLLLGAIVALNGCGSHETPRVVLAEKCTPIGGAQPMQFNAVSPAQGTLRVAVTQRGISTIVSTGSTVARSPIDRFGVTTLAVYVRKGQTVPVAVRTRDSPDVIGEICVSADLLPAGDKQRLRAERALALAGQAAQAEDWRRAFDLYRDAVRDFDGIDELRVAQARHAMGWISYWNLRNDEGAYVLAAWSLADFGPGTDPGVQSSLIALQAATFLEQQRITVEERRAHVVNLLRIAEERARLSEFGARELPRFEILRGFIEWSTGDINDAGNRFVGAARDCEAQRDWECAARARQNLAMIAEEGREYPAALQSYQRALDTLPPELDPMLTADIWGNYGRLQSMTGLIRQAEASHRTSMRLHAKLDDCDGTRMASARLGTLLLQVGNVSEARIDLARAAALECRPLIETAKRESSMDSMGVIEDASARRNELVCLESPDPEALSEPGMIAVFNGLLGLYDASRLEGDATQAMRCLSSARNYAGTARTKLRLANAEGTALLDRGDSSQAEAAFKRGLSVADAAQIPAAYEHRSLTWLGLARSALRAQRPEQARKFAERALALGASRGDLRQVTDALQLTARSYSAEQQTERAASILRIATALIEQVPIDELDGEQRATWLATQHGVFAELTTLLANEAGSDESRMWQAFEVSERGRARSLRYAMGQVTDTRAMISSETASARYRELMAQITNLGRETQKSPDGQPLSVDALAELITQRATPSDTMPAALQQRLASLDATIVEYAAGEEDVLAFVINGEHIRVVPLGRRGDINAAVTSLYERVRNPESAVNDVRSSARRLAELALWPLADAITGRRVIFIPDDALHTVPFALLPWSAGNDAQLLIQRMELSVMPSTLFLSHASASRASLAGAPRLELIGDPVFHKADWQRECHRMVALSNAGADRERSVSDRVRSLPRLPGSREELAGIAELARHASPKGDVHEHLGCDATRQALRDAAATGPTLLHIATHGYVDAFRPRLSALALTPDADSDGTFGLLDILQMKIESRLVVLSACDTSRGRLLPGEGVLGPAQAFLQAGASSVVASYWRISDQATAQFMRTFYRHLLLEHLPAAAALREAQLEYASQGGAHDWAAFTLFGWPDSRL